MPLLTDRNRQRCWASAYAQQVDEVAKSVRFHARPWARAIGAACLALGIFLVVGALVASDVGFGGAVVIVSAALSFIYFGLGLAWGYVSASAEALTIREGMRVRRIDAAAIAAFEVCNAKLFIARQRTVGVRVGEELLRLNLLARYPTSAGLRRLDEQQVALEHALWGGSRNRT